MTRTTDGTKPGDDVLVLRNDEPHVEIAGLTQLQMSVLQNAQIQYRRIKKEEDGAPDLAGLLARADSIRLNAVLLDLVFAGHIAMDLAPEGGFKYCRLWVAPVAGEQTVWAGPKLVQNEPEEAEGG